MTQVQNFRDHQKDFDAPILKESAQKREPKKEQIKHILMGPPKAVSSTINHLHVIGYANVGDWSQLLPTANPDEVMSILIRQILVS